MYVGPWQEFRLMRAIDEVRVENEKLQTILHSMKSSGPATPRSTLSASSTTAAAMPSLHRQSHNNNTASHTAVHQSTNARRGVPQLGTTGASLSQGRGHPLPPPPLNRQALQSFQQQQQLGRRDEDLSSVATTVRTTQSAPAMSSVRMGENGGGTSAVHDLLRRAPPSSFEKEQKAGVKPRQRPPSAGPLKADALAERQRRRSQMSSLYSGQQQPPPPPLEDPGRGEEEDQEWVHPRTSAAKGNVLTRPQLLRSHQVPTTTSQASGTANSNNGGGGAGKGGMVNRNVMRDLTRFYDEHMANMNQQQHQQHKPANTSTTTATAPVQPPQQYASVPWDTVMMPVDPLLSGAPFASTATGRPAYLPPSRYDGPAAASSVNPPSGMMMQRPAVLSSYPQPLATPGSPLMQQQQHSTGSSFGVSGAGGSAFSSSSSQMAQQQATLRDRYQRPYDVGPPPPQGAAYTHLYPSSTSQAFLGSSSSSATTTGHLNSTQRDVLLTTTSSIAGADLEGTHSLDAEADHILRSSLDRRQGSMHHVPYVVPTAVTQHHNATVTSTRVGNYATTTSTAPPSTIGTNLPPSSPIKSQRYANTTTTTTQLTAEALHSQQHLGSSSSRDGASGFLNPQLLSSAASRAPVGGGGVRDSVGSARGGRPASVTDSIEDVASLVQWANNLPM